MKRLAVAAVAALIAGFGWLAIGGPDWQAAWRFFTTAAPAPSTAAAAAGALCALVATSGAVVITLRVVRGWAPSRRRGAGALAVALAGMSICIAGALHHGNGAPRMCCGGSVEQVQAELARAR